jgi:hypothetical protein
MFSNSFSEGGGTGRYILWVYISKYMRIFLLQAPVMEIGLTNIPIFVMNYFSTLIRL